VTSSFADIMRWQPRHVREYLDWSVTEHNVQGIDVTSLPELTGRQLYSLTAEDLAKMIGNFDVANAIKAHIEYLRRGKS